MAEAVKNPNTPPVAAAPAPAPAAKKPRKRREDSDFIPGSPADMEFECGVTGHMQNADGSVTLKIAICGKRTTTSMYEGVRAIRIRKVSEESVPVAPEVAAEPTPTPAPPSVTPPVTPG